MKKRSLGLFLLVFFMVMGMWVVPAMSAYFTLDYTPDTGSFFFGQRGAGVAIEGVRGTTDFGHPAHNPGSPLAVDMYGAGSAFQTVTKDLIVYTVGEQLVHSIEVEFSNSDTAADIGLYASLAGATGMLPFPLNVTVTNNNWESSSYADAWGKTVLAINGDDGEAVRVHINSWATSNTNGSFDTVVSLGGCYPDNFSIWHNGVKIWDAGSEIFDPNGTILDNLIIDAVVGDTITLNARVCATLSGTVWDEVFMGNYANVNFHAAVELEPVPIPCEGDFDFDGDVDGSDLAVFAADFGRTDCGTGPPCKGDFDGDGDVDGSDLAVFAADFGRTDCLD